MKKLLLLALAIFFATAAFAQDAPKVEVAADYSYFRAPQGGFVPSSSLNGGGVSACLLLLQTRRPQSRVSGLRQLRQSSYRSRQHPGLQQPLRLPAIR